MRNDPTSLPSPGGIPRRRFLGWSATGLALLGAPVLLSACGDDSGSGAASGTTAAGPVEVPKNIADVIKIGGVYSSTVNPLSRIGGSANHAFGDPLIWVAPGQDPKPHLVESWEQDSETSTVFTLRSGVKFHDGTELTAEDVKFSIDTIKEAGSGPASSLATITGVEVLSPTQFRVTTGAPDPILVRRMYLVFPVPAASYDADAFALKPIGVGPWIPVENDTAAQILRCERNENWWRGEVATPRAEFYGFSDQTATQAALEAGQIDAATLHASANATLAGRDGFNVTHAAMGSAGMLSINTHEGPLSDARVRRALNHAIDRQALIDNVLFGAGYQMEGQLAGADCNGHVEDWEDPFPYDPELARELLADAGYPDGFDTEIEVSLDPPTVEAVAGYFREVGVNATVKTIENSQWLQGFVRGSSAPMFHKGVNYSPLYDVDVVNNYMTFPPPGLMEGGFQAWSDETWDRLHAESRALSGEERQAKLTEMAHHLAEQAPIVFLYHQTYTYGWSTSLKNYIPDTGFFTELHETFKEV